MTFVGAVIRGHRVAAALIAATGFAVIPWLDLLLNHGPAPSLVGLTGLAAWLLVLFGVGEGVRIRHEREAEAVRMQEEESLRRVSEERLRIARELHDALGHHLSLINVQAGVALHVNEELPSQVSGSLAAIGPIVAGDGRGDVGPGEALRLPQEAQGRSTAAVERHRLGREGGVA